MSKNYGNDSQMSEIVKYISDTMKFPIMGAGGGFAPIGTINSYMGTIAPIGWLACDGTVYNIADYPDLATHIASHFGSTNFFGGDGTTTFGVPDLRGEFLRGSGTNSHTNQGSGANVGVHQDGTEQSAVDGISQDSWASAQVAGTISPNLYNNYDSMVSESGVAWTVAKKSNPHVSTGAIMTSRPTNTSVLFIIKATVAGDPNAHQYSTEEQVVGTYNGKYLYEKSWFNVSVSNNTTVDLTSMESTLEHIKSIEGMFYQSSSNNEFPIGCNANCWCYYEKSFHGIAFQSSANWTGTMDITIQYTKTQ